MTNINVIIPALLVTIVISEVALYCGEGNCGQGEMLRNGSCMPCPEDRYMDRENHACQSCFLCTEPSSSSYQVVIKNCTAISDTILACKPGFFKSGPEKDPLCSPCKKCLPGEVTQNCTTLADTICMTTPTSATTTTPESAISTETSQTINTSQITTNSSITSPTSASTLSVGDIIGIVVGIIIIIIIIAIVLIYCFCRNKICALYGRKVRDTQAQPASPEVVAMMERES